MESAFGPPPHTNVGAEKNGERQMKKLLTPREIIAHYELQGVSAEEAPLKAIDDLQQVLVKVLRHGRGVTSSKTGSINMRLDMLDMKLDSKPGYSQSMAIGVASGFAVRGLSGIFPHVLRAFWQMWSAVKSSTDS